MCYREIHGGRDRSFVAVIWPFVCLICLAGIAHAQSALAQSDSAQSEYELQPGDLLAVTVYEEAELSREVLVRPDGGISFPLIGDIEVAGLSPAEVKAELETELAEFIPGASVTVAVLQITGNRVFVVGKVNAPGAYPIYRPLDVMQALALAGGTAQFAELDDIRILRRDNSGRQDVIEFKYSDVIRGRNLDQNLLLKSGDTIVVP